MKVGMAETDVTPPVGCWILGPVAPSTGVHDPLYARAFVMDDGETLTAIVGIDLIGFGWELSDKLRFQIKSEAGVDSVFLQLSHTHNAPFPPSWMTSIYKLDKDRLSGWREGLLTKLPAMVKEAVDRRQAAELRTGRAPVQVGFNRRVMHEDGMRMEPNPDGPVVPWVDTLSAHGEDGQPVAVIYCHAAHPVIVHGSSTLMSADYPGYAAARIRKKLGSNVVPVFVQGCGANINGDSVAGGYKKAEKAGNRLGDAVVKAIENAVPVSAERMSLVARTLALPCINFPPAVEVEKKLSAARAMAAEQIKDKGEARPYAVDNIEALEDLKRLMALGDRPSMRFDLTLLSIGKQWLFASLSGEVFCDYQLWIDENAPFDKTMVSAYSSNFGGYIPMDADLELGVKGGYESGCWPAESCALIVPTRVALHPGIEKTIKGNIEEMWLELS